MRGATAAKAGTLRPVTFQSTRPMRGATHPFTSSCRDRSVSIHAPHAGRDAHPAVIGGGRRCFNPRAPCGARPRLSGRRHRLSRFNPRAPCGARPRLICSVRMMPSFQSTRPMRGATYDPSRKCAYHHVSIHAPHAGRDILTRLTSEYCFVSIHAPHAGRDLHPSSCRVQRPCFNPRAPCGARPVPMFCDFPI